MGLRFYYIILHISEILFLFQAVLGAPDGRIFAAHHGVKSVVPAFHDVRRALSWEEKLSIIEVVPFGMTEEGSPS